MKNNVIILLSLIFLVIIFSSCENDDTLNDEAELEVLLIDKSDVKPGTKG